MANTCCEKSILSEIEIDGCGRLKQRPTSFLPCFSLPQNPPSLERKEEGGGEEQGGAKKTEVWLWCCVDSSLPPNKYRSLSLRERAVISFGGDFGYG